MADKMRPCCARFANELMAEQAELARLARLAARLEARGRSIGKIKDQIAAAKASIEESKRHVIDHEASHLADDEAAERWCCSDCGSENLHEGPNDPPPYCCCKNCGSANVAPCTQGHFELRA